MKKTATLHRSGVLDKIELDVPKSWNDFTKEQLLDICSLYENPKVKAEFMSMAAMITFDLKIQGYKDDGNFRQYILEQRGKRIGLTADEVRFISRHFEFLIGESDLIHNRIPVIRIGVKKYYGPSDKIYNVGYDEFRSAENFFLAFNKTKDTKYLDQLMAVLYRPRNRKMKETSPDYDGDLRMPFNSFTLKKRAAKMSRLPMRYKIATFQFFHGCMRRFHDMFPMVFESSGGGMVTDRVYQSLKMLDWLSNGDITKIPKILQSNVYEVMTRMQSEREKIKQIEKLNSRK